MLRYLPNPPNRDSLRGLEGAAAVQYFAGLRHLILPGVPDDLRSDHRGDARRGGPGT